MKFCSECGSRVTLSPVPGAQQGRFVCDGCRRVFYQSPRLIAGCIACRDDKILLCRRAIDPGYGLWALPAGFVETGESAALGAVRETLEEAQVTVEIDRLYALFHIPHLNQVHLLFLARLLDGPLIAGAESLEVKLFGETDLPWGDLAFATSRDALRQYFRDADEGTFGFHFGEIVPFTR